MKFKTSSVIYFLNGNPPHCTAAISANKTVAPYIGTGVDAYALPVNDLIYTLNVTHEGGPDLDADSVFNVDQLPAEVIFYNDDIDDLGPETNPIAFTNNGSTLTFNYAADIGFSDDAVAPVDMTDCDYIPIVGYDSDVRFVCINSSGVFNSATPNPSFSVSFRTRLK